MSLTLQEALAAIGVALAAGGLIGAEREQAHTGRAGADFGGIRTFPLVALSGVLGALLRPALGAWLLASLLVAVAALLAISHARSRADDVGVSSEIAAVVTFLLGAIAGTRELMDDGPRFLLVAAAAATTMALLALKRPLHGLVAKVSESDVYATTKFVLLALVLIPILPNRTYGPLDVLNPFKVGLMITLVAGISFAGYVAARAVGSRRGLLVTAVLGGLVSSTAVTATFSGRAKEAPGLVPLATVAIVAASTIMFARVVTVVGIVDPALTGRLAVPLGAMALAGVLISAILLRRGASRAGANDAVPLANPFELTQAVKFGLLYAVILFVARAAQVYVGTRGIYGSAMLSGLADVDAITLSLTELHRAGASAGVVTTAITLAVVTNTLVKVGIAVVAGGAALGRRVGVVLAVVLAAGGAAMVVARVLGD